MVNGYTIISIPNYNDSFSRVIIKNVAYLIRFTYEMASDCWVFGIFDLKYNPIVQGIKIVPGIPLNLQYTDDTLPPVYWIAKSKLDRIGYRDFWDGKAEFLYVEKPEE